MSPIDCRGCECGDTALDRDSDAGFSDRIDRDSDNEFGVRMFRLDKTDVVAERRWWRPWLSSGLANICLCLQGSECSESSLFLMLSGCDGNSNRLLIESQALSSASSLTLLLEDEDTDLE